MYVPTIATFENHNIPSYYCSNVIDASLHVLNIGISFTITAIKMQITVTFNLLQQ